jgi:acetate kinase
MRVLVLNSGSSSQKSALFELRDAVSPDPQPPLWEAKIEWNQGSAVLKARNSRGNKTEKEVSAADRQGAIERMLETLWSGETAVGKNASEINVVGHRIVHGGPKLKEPIRVTPEVKKTIADAAAFAPLHNRAELEGIETIERVVGPVPQVAVFDTGFHRTIPPAAALYPGPYDWQDKGIRRYGFHGINHEYCSKRAAQMLGRDISQLRIVSCHLGNGCSLAAIAGGKSVDTTMGFTPLEGLMMGTRSGSIDPGILTYLLRETGISGQEIDDILNQRSGLLGISGISSDMREVEAAAQSGDQRAQLAFDMFVHRLRKGIADMAAVLGGADVLVFTAGIGENSSAVRAGACSGLHFLGMELDSEKNAHTSGDQEISATNSGIRVLVIHAQEDWAIAQDCARVLNQALAAPRA